MIKDFFIFDGVSSADFNVIVDSAEVFGKPAVGLSTVKIPGRSGDLLIYDNRMENVNVSYQCHCDYRFRSRFDNLVMELASRRGYKRLEDSVYPGHFRRAYFQGPVGAKLLRTYRAGSFKVDFNADPRKFLKAGEMPEKYTVNGSIYNPTLFTAEPLIYLYGTAGGSGAFNIKGNQQINVTFPQSGTIIIDSELGEAYDTNGTSLNSSVSFAASNTAQDFPKIDPGENAVLMWNLSSVAIIPRWWQL